MLFSYPEFDQNSSRILFCAINWKRLGGTLKPLVRDQTAVALHELKAEGTCAGEGNKSLPMIGEASFLKKLTNCMNVLS